MEQSQQLTAVKAIKAFFPDASATEIKALSAEERHELAELACQAIGAELIKKEEPTPAN